MHNFFWDTLYVFVYVFVFPICLVFVFSICLCICLFLNYQCRRGSLHTRLHLTCLTTSRLTQTRDRIITAAAAVPSINLSSSNIIHFIIDFGAGESGDCLWNSGDFTAVGDDCIVCDSLTGVCEIFGDHESLGR